MNMNKSFALVFAGRRAHSRPEYVVNASGGSGMNTILSHLCPFVCIRGWNAL
jgi:hypothetical protein